VILNQSRPGINPIFSMNLGYIPWLVLLVAGAFLATSVSFWIVLFVGDVIRHALRPSAAAK
jgi:hypothetical protein